MGTLRSTLQSCLPPLPFGLPFGLRLPSTGCPLDTGLRVATVELTCLLVERILILSGGAEVGKPVVDRRVCTELWVVPREQRMMPARWDVDRLASPDVATEASSLAILWQAVEQPVVVCGRAWGKCDSSSSCAQS